MRVINGVRISTDHHKEIPFVARRFSGDLVVLGSGSTLWQDYLKIYERHKGHYMAVNRVILDFPGILKHAVSAHPYALVMFTLLRRFYYAEQPHVHTHSCNIHDEESYETHLIPQSLWDFPDYYHGSSTLTGVLAALVMGYDQIILAGVPMDGKGYYNNPLWLNPHGEMFMKDWEKANAKCFHGKVKSLSGNTRELLGAPPGL